MKQHSVCAGIVAHNPDIADVNVLIERLLASSKWVVVVDNSSADKSYLENLAKQPGVRIIRNNDNRGVSGGINQIIDYARQVKADFVAAFDQDTKISPDLVNTLASNFERLLASGELVAAIGPLVIDDYTNHSLPFIQFRLPLNAHYSREESPESDQLVECDFLISSGCLMSMKAIDDIGSMNEALFIDNVDLDWCFRASHKKYKVYGDFGSVIRQQIGSAYTKIPFTKAVIRYHDYNRIYYMTRNRVWLYRQQYVNRSWVVHDVCRLTCKFLYLFLFKRGRTVLLRRSVKGIIDSFAMRPYNNVSP
jgi:rhamnosyltransferase